jgi:hypothetical protein
MWDFVGKRGSYKTFKRAVECAESHKSLWTKVIDATGIRKLEELFGKVPLGIPTWVKAKLSRNIYALLMDTNTGKKKDL